MQILAAVAIGILIGVSILVSLRLLLVHRRTGAWPELCLGGMLLLSVGLGYPLRIAADRASGDWAGAFTVVSAVAMGVGFSLLFVFTWRVFEPQATWARALATAGVLAVLAKAAHGCLRVLGGGPVDLLEEPLGVILWETGPLFVAYVWTAWESLRYHGMMRRRVELGLADVAVTNRFLLWGLMALAASLGVVLNTCGVALGLNAFESPWILLPSTVTGLSQAVFLMLAFAPPRSYLRWVRAGQGVSEA